MKKRRNKILVVLAFAVVFAQSTYAQWKNTAIQFANSEMQRFPEVRLMDHGSKYVWGYAQGLEALAILKVWKATGDVHYFNFVEQWADTMIRNDGSILNYKVSDYNVDFVNAGKILFLMYQETGNQKYRLAMDTLIQQLKGQPQTSDGVFWHKMIYPHQIWLDGIYMAGPFMAEYGSQFHDSNLVNHALHELIVTYKHTYDSNTGLLYHAYDESREQRWANKKTGQSPHFWGRAMGWYFMAMVDVLDYVPVNHPQRAEVITMMNALTKAIVHYQDSTGLWYQVVDMGDSTGNYLEASASSMFMYSIAKAVNKGYIDEKYISVAKKAYAGLMNHLIKWNTDGTLTLTKCCAVAGLGGNPYRDGSYSYYIHERIRDNDAKATSPFIMGCLELGQYEKEFSAAVDSIN